MGGAVAAGNQAFNLGSGSSAARTGPKERPTGRVETKKRADRSYRPVVASAPSSIDGSLALAVCSLLLESNEALLLNAICNHRELCGAVIHLTRKKGWLTIARLFRRELRSDGKGLLMF